MENKEYTGVEIEIIRFDKEDVITASQGSNNIDNYDSFDENQLMWLQ